jgi:hypothetical protein
MTQSMELTGRQMDALRVLATHRFDGIRQANMVSVHSVTRSLMVTLMGKGLAESIHSSVGVGWFITDAGLTVLNSKASP